jgi:site-specific DNA-methyltransferase (adenine-specific)
MEPGQMTRLLGGGGGVTECVQIGAATLYRGDALEVLAELPDAGVDAVITDPPYFLPAQHYCTRRRFPRSISDFSILEHFYRDVFAMISRVLRTTGVQYVFCDGQSYPVFFTVIYPHVRRVVPLIWDKVVCINGFSWRHQHEIIVFAEMDDAPAVKTGDGDILRCRAVAIDDRDHPAEKPPSLVRRLIEKSISGSGVVIDPFMGSGAIGEAVVASGRVFIGAELNREYFNVACRRIEDAQRQATLPLVASA